MKLCVGSDGGVASLGPLSRAARLEGRPGGPLFAGGGIGGVAAVEVDE